MKNRRSGSLLFRVSWNSTTHSAVAIEGLETVGLKQLNNKINKNEIICFHKSVLIKRINIIKCYEKTLFVLKKIDNFKKLKVPKSLIRHQFNISTYPVYTLYIHKYTYIHTCYIYLMRHKMYIVWITIFRYNNTTYIKLMKMDKFCTFMIFVSTVAIWMLTYPSESSRILL